MLFDKSLYQSLKKLQTVCLRQNIPFASYRLPLDTEIITLVQQHSLPKRLNSIENIDKETGFIVSPFDKTEVHGTYLLEPDCILDSNNIEDIYIQNLSENNRYLSKKGEVRIKTTAANDYINDVSKAIEAINTGAFHKVVLSKIRLENVPLNFEPHTFFLKLCEKYPTAFVYLIQLPEVGCWMGATPETLLVVENELVKTVSLAGTQIASSIAIEAYNWEPKEVEEQKIVTDFVEKTIQSIGIKNYNKTGPTNCRAANLIHLKTVFEFAKVDLKDQFSELLNALHPTPSVGGLPKAESVHYILENEKHDRTYYSGFLGPININKKINIFVNLRCLQLFEKQVVLYSGAGITSSSIAEKEWEETNNKMMTLMNVIMTPNP